MQSASAALIASLLACVVVACQTPPATAPASTATASPPTTTAAPTQALRAATPASAVRPTATPAPPSAVQATSASSNNGVTEFYSRPRSVFARDAFALSVASDGRGTILVGDGRPQCSPDGGYFGRVTTYSSTGEIRGSWSAWAGSWISHGQEQATAYMRAIDSHGNAFAVSSGGFRLVKLSPTGELLQLIGKDASQPFDQVVTAAVGNNDTLWVADANRILELSPQYAVIAEFGKFDKAAQAPDGSAPLGDLNGVSGIALDQTGNVFVVDTGHDRVQVLDPATGVWRSFGSRGDDAGQFRDPSSIALDSQGNVFVVDSGNMRVQKLSRLGEPLGQWRPHEWASETYSATGAELAIDTSGYLYVSDPHFDRVLKVAPGAFLPPGRLPPDPSALAGHSIAISPPVPACGPSAAVSAATAAAIKPTPVPVQLGANLVTNSSFEGGTDTPAGWSALYFDATTPSGSVVTGDAHSGTRSVSITGDLPKPSLIAGWTSDPLSLDPTKRYVISVWAKETRAGGAASGTVWFYLDDGPNHKVISSSSLNGSWQEIRGEVAVAKSAATLWINYRAAVGVKGARALIDDVSVAPLQ